MRLKLSFKDLVFAGLSALLLVLSFPKFDLGLVAWVALVPLLVALEGKGLKEALLLSYLTGLIFIAGIFYWIWSERAFNPLNYTILGVIYLPQYLSLWGLGLNWVRIRTGLGAALVAPPLWVTLEYIRSHAGFLSSPWMLLGHSQYLHPSLIQISSLTGVYGLSFLIVLTNAAIGELILYYSRQRFAASRASSSWQQFPWRSLVAASLILLATYTYGLFVLAKGTSSQSIKIALVQGNIPQEKKWEKSYRQTILDRYAGLTKAAAREAPALIIWPETAVPGDVEHDPGLKRTISRLAIETKSYLLVGSAEYAKFTDMKLRGKFFNSMYLFSPDGNIEEQYRKIVLVPFSEYVPLKDYVKWPKAIASTRIDILPGDRHTLFTVGAATFGATICWENIFPDLFREFVKRGASFIVNGTNEARFGETAEPHQHLAINTFRAAENRVAIARSANTGISAFIDPFGRITERLRDTSRKELFVEGVLIGNVILSNEKTVYTRYGDVFAFLQIAFCTLLLLLSCLTSGLRRKLTLLV